MPNSKTVIGINEKTLTIENIVTKKASTFGKLKGIFKTLLYDEVTQTLFAGDERGRIKQYRRGNCFCPFTLLKDYGRVGIGVVYSSAQVNGFAFFAGSNRSLVAINIHERQLCEGKIRNPFTNTISLQVCQGLDSKVYLSLGGSFPLYYSTISDFLDVSEICKIQQTGTKKNAQETNHMLTIPLRKDRKNDFIEPKIKKLGSDLLTEETKTKGIFCNTKRYKK